MTVGTITSRVRRLIEDNGTILHWTDEQIKNDLQLSVRALHKIRPETRYTSNGIVESITLPASSSDDIGIDGRFEDCLVYHTAYLVYSDDCTDGVSKQLADSFLEKFMAFALM